MGYTKDAVSGFTWLGAFRIFSRALSFGRIAIIARILSPEQFGLFGIVSLVLAMLEIFTETGINIFLVQQKQSFSKYVNTAWIVSIIRGFLIAATMLIASPFIANFFNEPEVYQLILIMCAIPIVRGFINPSVVSFQKELQFKKEFLYRSIIITIEAVISIVLVLLFNSPVALIVGLIGAGIFEVILSFILVRPLPNFSFNKKLFVEVMHASKWLTSSGIFNYLYHHGDDIIVGKVLGTASLGVYDMIYRMSLLPITEVGDVVSRTTLPVYVKIADDKKRLQRAYFKTILGVGILVIPLGAVLVIFPEAIIRLVLGEKWISGAPVLQVLAIFGAVRAVIYAMTMIFLALKMERIPTILSFIGFAGMIVTIFPFIMLWGLVGAGLSVLFGSLIMLPAMLYYVSKIFKGT